MNIQISRSFEDIGQRDFDEDCGELSRAEMRAGRCSWDYMTNAPIEPPLPRYHGFRDPPEPAPVWRPKLDAVGVAMATASIIFCAVALLILIS